MLPEDFGTVGTALLAIVPGYVATAVWARARTWRGPAGDLRTILQSLVLSLVIQLALAPLTIAWLYPVREQILQYPERLAGWLALAVLVLPVGGGLAVGKLTNFLSDPTSAAVRGRFRRAIARLWPAPAPPSIWDWIFTVRPPHGSFLVVEYKDGTRVAGAFAEGSLALTSPEPHGLFLVSEWQLDQDGNIVGPVPGSAGVTIVRTDEIRSIRVLEAEE